jgi:anti-anti-sigma factor
MLDVRQVPSAAGRITVAASGQVDLATAPRLASALAQARDDGSAEIVVDLAGVDFLDSAGVRVLVQAARDTTAAGATLYLDGAQGWVARVLEITGLATHLPPPPAPNTDG